MPNGKIPLADYQKPVSQLLCGEGLRSDDPQALRNICIALADDAETEGKLLYPVLQDIRPPGAKYS